MIGRTGPEIERISSTLSAFGNTMPATPGVRRERDVIVEPFRSCAIDANQDGMLGREPGGESGACGDPFGGRHGIFEVDDHRVGSAVVRLGEALRAIAGHEQVRTRVQEFMEADGRSLRCR